MINPSEMEVEEVDHSFFDSDCGSGSEHEEKKVEQVIEEGSHAASEGFPTKTSESRHGDRNLRTDETSDDTGKVKNHTNSNQTKSSRNRRDNNANLNYERPKDVIQNLYSSSSERLQTSSTDGSDYSVTDVSPLSSPDSSKSLCLDHTKTEAVDYDEYQGESLPSSGLGNKQQDQDVDECSSLSLESEFQNKVVIHYPRKKKRQNYSFTDDEVQRIDRENYLLLQKLSRLSPGLQPESAPRRKTHVASVSPLVHTSHSGLNRKREQQRIQRENLVLLKKLESTKPTLGLKRSQQLAEYQRNVGSQGLPSYSISRSGMDKGPASRMSSTGSKSVSQFPRTPLPTTKKTRPDWC